jgi:hypothetical protein
MKRPWMALFGSDSFTPWEWRMIARAPAHPFDMTDTTSAPDTPAENQWGDLEIARIAQIVRDDTTQH